MIKIRIILLDRTREGFIRKGEEHYLKRIKRYTKIEYLALKPVKHGRRSDKEILELEKSAILKSITKGDYIVSLDSKGKEFHSEEFAFWLKGLHEKHNGWVTFLIGGPLGLDQELLELSHLRLSLSRLTFTHEMSRLILLEQIYRAFTILRGEPYHK